MNIVGIDPGQTGAIANIGEGWITGSLSLPILGSKHLDCMELLVWLRDMRPGKIIIERAQAMPKQGVVSMFNYGRLYGQLLAAIEIYGASYIEVSASEWKRKMGLLKKDKDESIRMARQLFPHVDLNRKKDHGRAEALLLCEYGKRFLGG